MNEDERREGLREKLAAEQHEIWSHWMKYFFSKCPKGDEWIEGSTVWHERLIDKEDYERWQRQMKTPYADLTEKEKESDRHQADKIIAVLDDSPTMMPLIVEHNALVTRVRELETELEEQKKTSVNRLNRDDIQMLYHRMAIHGR